MLLLFFRLFVFSGAFNSEFTFTRFKKKEENCFLFLRRIAKRMAKNKQ